MSDIASGVIALAFILVLAVLAAWISVRPERRFRRALASRDPLSEEQFYEAYYTGSKMPREIPRRLRPIYCRFFDIDPMKLRPEDRPPEVAEIDTSKLIQEIEAAFGLTEPLCRQTAHGVCVLRITADKSADKPDRAAA